MDQLPPDSHWATASHSAAVAAEALPAAIRRAATAPPVTPAMAQAREALAGRRSLPLSGNSRVRSPHRRIPGALSRSHPWSCQATPLTGRGFTPSRIRCQPPDPALTLGPPLLPTAHDATTVPVLPLAGFGVAAAGARDGERS